MTAILWMQKVDTILLVVIMLSALIIYLEDKEASWPCRMFWIILGFGSFAQATWLQSYWWPSAAGYPWGGLVRDFGFAGYAALRTYTVLTRLYAAKNLEQVQRAARMT